jgi:hypothetical protein
MYISISTETEDSIAVTNTTMNKLNQKPLKPNNNGCPSYFSIIDDTDRAMDWAQAAAISTALTNAPRYDGLTDVQISYVANWGATEVPEPSTLAIFALGLMGLASRRFKKQS